MSVFKKHLLVTLNLSLPENLCPSHNTSSKKVAENYCLRGINSCISDKKTAYVWDKLRESCKTKSRTKWQDSVESDSYFRALGVEKSVTRDGHGTKDDSLWNLQRCTCQIFRRRALETKGALDGMTIGGDEECDSPCLCPKYFISRSGVVFSSFEEVRATFVL